MVLIEGWHPSVKCRIDIIQGLQGRALVGILLINCQQLG